MVGLRRLLRRGSGLTALLAVAAAVCLAVAVGAPDAPAPAPAVLEVTGPPAPEWPLRTGVAATASTSPPVVGAVLPDSPPTRLAIPAIGVDSTLLSLGQEANGTLEVPAPGPDYDEAGWYRYSPTPGALGPAVLAGHVDSAAAGPSVFFRLTELQPGDEVLVDRADRRTAVFRVDRVRRYSKTDFPTALVYGDTDHAALRLITCGGSFDRTTGHYVDNVVVTATLVRVQRA